MLSMLFGGWLMATQAVSSEPQKVNFGVLDLNFPPYQTLVDGKPVGPDIDVVREAFNRMSNYQLVEQMMPLKRVLHEIDTGRIDIATLYKSPSRLNVFLFPDTPIRWSIYRLAVLNDQGFEFQRTTDLHGRTIGKLERNVISEAFDQAGREKHFDLLELKSFDTMLNMLSHQRLEAIVGHEQVIGYVASTMGLGDKITFLPKPVRPAKEFHIVISPRSDVTSKEDLRQALSAALGGMLQDGTFDKIYNRYGLKFARNAKPEG